MVICEYLTASSHFYYENYDSEAGCGLLCKNFAVFTIPKSFVEFLRRYIHVCILLQ